MSIDEGEYIMKSKDCTYHQNCFKCSNCEVLINSGQQFTHVDAELYCANECNIKREFKHEEISRNEGIIPFQDFPLNDNDTMYTLDNISNENSDTDSLCGADQKHQENKNKICSSNKRPRTILNQAQRKLFKAAFEATPKPCRKVIFYWFIGPCHKVHSSCLLNMFFLHLSILKLAILKVRDKLAMETGLSQRVVQVWFQNQRAKIKKLSKRQKGKL